MKDLAILVDNKNDSTEAQDLLFSMGYKWRGLGEISKSYFYPKMNKYFIFMNKNEMDLQVAGYFAGSSRSYTESRFKEITIPELRDLVVLKREENLKEYLRKNSNGTYSYIGTVRPEHVSDFMIEIPEGAGVFMTGFNTDRGCAFYKDDFNMVHGDNWKWESCRKVDISDHAKVVWSRHTHPEELPFIDDEPSLNDQYAEIEKVRQTLNQRQEQYGSFEDVAMITEQMVDVMRRGYYENLAYNQKMALYMICSKMARIVNGNPNHKDSWHDIAGYATLIDNELVSEKDMPF